MIFIALAFLKLAHAEYRVFELVISDPTTGQERTVRSNLTPAQYRAYYGVNAQETVMYTATWKCLGNTSRKPFCPNPKDQGDAASAPSRP
jgi:hypothetical protein